MKFRLISSKENAFSPYFEFLPNFSGRNRFYRVEKTVVFFFHFGRNWRTLQVAAHMKQLGLLSILISFLKKLRSETVQTKNLHFDKGGSVGVLKHTGGPIG